MKKLKLNKETVSILSKSLKMKLIGGFDEVPEDQSGKMGKHTCQKNCTNDGVKSVCIVCKA